MLRLAKGVAALIVMIASLAAHADEVRISDPRPFGYFLGDTLTRTIEIDGPAGETIVPATLPIAGPTAYWLEIRHADGRTESHGEGTRHVITIEYQIFYAAIDPRALDIPGQTIALQVGETQRTVRIPPLAVTVSPLREIFPDKERAQEANMLWPDVLARPAPLAPWRTAALGSAALALSGLLLLAHHKAWGPFRGRASRPFSRAAATIAAEYGQHPEREAYPQALMALHRAFDERAGRRVFADDVSWFLEQYGEHDASSDDIEGFFEASRHVFFAGDVEDGLAILPRDRLQALAADLARQERAVR